MQGSFVGIVEGDFAGFQAATVNLTEGKFEELQIGLIDVIRTRGQFPIFPIVIWSF